MTNYYQLSETKGAGMESRYYVDGKRVSQEKAEHIKQMGFMYGRVSCFHTKAWQVQGNKIRRTNYSVIQY